MAAFQSGQILSAGTYGGGATLPTSGTCDYDVTDGGPYAQGAVLQLNISMGSVSSITVLNVGSGFTATPSHAQPASGSNPCSGNITFGATLAPYTNGGPLNLASNLAASALAAGKPVRVNESNRPVYVKVNCGPTEDRGIFDTDYAEWAVDGMDNLWFGTIAAWASATGFSSVSPYATQMWSWYNSVNINGKPPCLGPSGANNCPGPAQYQLLYLDQTSVSGAYWARIAQWVSSSLQGNAQLSGSFMLQ